MNYEWSQYGHLGQICEIFLSFYLSKKIRHTLPRSTIEQPHFGAEISNEVAYADDVDFIGQTIQISRRSKKEKKDTSLNSSLTRQYTSISKSEEGWKVKSKTIYR